jgi:dTDP-4-amino-4,6-dideoxygalactose transaminase
MFPFEHGGSLIIRNTCLAKLNYNGADIDSTKYNPWKYDIFKIACVRRNNYLALEELIDSENIKPYFIPLKDRELLNDNIPQTFPIKIIKGDRNKIYEIMNEAGFGVVSLYHTLIEPLRNSQFQESIDLSERIMNLPIHQDVDSSSYPEMIRLLVKTCKETSSKN